MGAVQKEKSGNRGCDPSSGKAVRTALIRRSPFFLINSYTTGLAPSVLSYMMGVEIVPKFGGTVKADEVGLPVSQNGLTLPCGASGRWEK